MSKHLAVIIGDAGDCITIKIRARGKHNADASEVRVQVSVRCIKAEHGVRRPVVEGNVISTVVNVINDLHLHGGDILAL